MAEAYLIAVQSNLLDGVDLGQRNIARNLARAINSTTRWAKAESSREIREQVKLPARYLSGANGRLQQTKVAQPSDLSAIITGRHRPTSLARFARNARRSGQTGARVEVSPGSARFMPRAFFIKLRSGADGSNNNLGLAIRLPEGKRPGRAYRPKLVGRNLWLLYGPSVDQVFDDVAEDISPEAADRLEREFLRLTDIDLK